MGLLTYADVACLKLQSRRFARAPQDLSVTREP